MRTGFTALLATLVTATMVAQPRPGGTLDLYLVDVEGGNATLLVGPSGDSLLIDTGNGGQAATRDVGRIMAVTQAAGLARIDHLLTTHYHGDHYGGMSELASRIPVRHFIDHGPSVEANAGIDAFLQKTYPALYERASRTIVKPGDRIEMAGLDVRVPTSGGAAIGAALPGAGSPNPHCARFTPGPVDDGENAQSVGVHVTFGRFRALHLGDLTVNKEFDLMCPGNRLGTIDLFVVSHHGQPTSNSEVLVHAIEPRVALINNGMRKGGQPDAMRVLFTAPGLEDIWQLHASQLGGQEYTPPGVFIANLADGDPAPMPIPPPAGGGPGRGGPGRGAPPPPAHNGEAFWIKVSARNDGAFTVTNTRNGFTKAYRPRP
jgi:beta-lactamase superfamily II metal-dependent hydrolase